MLTSTPSTFTSNIDNDIVIELLYREKKTFAVFREDEIKEMASFINTFGIDSFKFNRETRHPISEDQQLAIYKAIFLAYSTH